MKAQTWSRILNRRVGTSRKLNCCSMAASDLPAASTIWTSYSTLVRQRQTFAAHVRRRCPAALRKRSQHLRESGAVEWTDLAHHVTPRPQLLPRLGREAVFDSQRAV